MQPMTIPEIISAVDGTWLNPRKGAAPVTAVCTDSRKIARLPVPAWVGSGSTAMTSSTGPGRGSRRVLVRRRPELLRLDKFYIQVADTGWPAGLASAYRDRFAIPLSRSPAAWARHHKGDAGGGAGGEAPGAEDTGELQQRHRHAPDPAGLGPEHQAAVIETGMNTSGRSAIWGRWCGRTSPSSPTSVTPTSSIWAAGRGSSRPRARFLRTEAGGTGGP